MMKKLILSILAAAICLGASAKLEVKQPCSDGMVLQQLTQAQVWGKASAWAPVKVQTGWDGKVYLAKADGKGVWRVKVQTPEASYNKYEIKVTGDGGSLTIRNILVGEVWIASGQSNMEMPVKGFNGCPVENSAEVISGTFLKDKVRMCYISIYQPEEPQDDVHETRGWEDATPAHVGEMSATAFFFARKINQALDVPVGILSFPRGGASVESWLPKETLLGWGDDLSPERMANEGEWSRPYQMYNGMQHPVQGYTAKGFIWYQGCTNVGRHEQFVPRMTELIRQWREDWGDTDNSMPFYMVEIAPYIYRGGQADKAAPLRQAQHETAASVPNCGIVVTNDLVASYERDNIHPSRKQPVGERLAYLAMNRDYGFATVPCQSPEAVEAYREDGDPVSMIRVKLTNCESGISRMHDIEGLEVCGSYGAYVPVKDAFCFNGMLLIRLEGIGELRGVRYGWGDFVPGNIANVEGLPLSPFDLKIKQ